MCSESPGYVTVWNSRMMKNSSWTRLFLPSFQRLALSKSRLEVPVPLWPKDEISCSALNRFTCRFSSLARLRVPEYYLLLAEALRAASVNSGRCFVIGSRNSRCVERLQRFAPHSLWSAQLWSLSRRYRVGGARNFHLIRFRVL